MPVTKIPGSRSMAMQSPSDSASLNLMLRAGLKASPDIGVQISLGWRIGGPRAFHGVFDVAGDAVGQRGERGLVRNAKADDFGSAAFDGTPLHPGFDFFARPVRPSGFMIKMRADMLEPQVGHAFQKGRPLAASQAIRQTRRSLVHGGEVVAVNPLRLQFERSRPFAEFRAGRLADGERAFRRIEIVLADVQDRQTADGGIIDALVEYPLFPGSLAKEGSRQPPLAAHGECQGRSGRDGNRITQNGGGGDEADGLRCQMGGPASAPGTAGLTAVQLRRQLIDAPAARQVMIVGPVMAVDNIARPQRRDNTDGNRLLTKSKMRGRPHLLLAI